MNFKYFFFTLVYLTIGMNAFSSQQKKIEFEEEKIKIYQVPQYPVLQKISPAEELKNTIREQTKKLISILEGSEFQQTAFQKGWLNKEYPEQGQLIQFLQEIDPSKKHILKKISDFYLIKNEEIFNLVSKTIAFIDRLPNVMIESKIREYFEGMNIGKVLSIDENQNGVQLKRIVTVQPLFSELPLKWYVKTHAGGLLQETKKSTSKPVDPIELLTYKILEHSGYGTESHFFYDDVRNFYIGTKDVGSYSDTQSVRDYPKFLTEDKSAFTKETMERYPSEEENQVIQGLMTSDIISRVLCLTDILTQDGNIVFVQNKDNWHLKIIDFRNSVSGYGYPDGSLLFSGLVDGNGQFNYIGVDKAVSHYLGTKKLPLRINFARIFDYKNLRAAVGKAEGEMYNYMNSKENFDLFKNTQEKVYEHSAAIQNIISQFEKAAIISIKSEKTLFDEK